MCFKVLNSVLSVIGGWVVCRPARLRVVGLLSLKISKILELYPVWLARLEAGLPLRRAPRRLVAGPRVCQMAEHVPVTGLLRPYDPGEMMARAATEAAVRADAEAMAAFRAEMAVGRKAAWLLKLMQHDGGFCSNQLREWLATEEAVRMALACPAFVRRMIPLCRAFGVDSHLLHYPGDMPVPPRRRRPVRGVRTREERWLAAHRRDPNPQCRFKNYAEDKLGIGWPARVEQRPRGSFWMEHPDLRAAREERQKREWARIEAARALFSEG